MTYNWFRCMFAIFFFHRLPFFFFFNHDVGGCSLPFSSFYQLCQLYLQCCVIRMMTLVEMHTIPKRAVFVRTRPFTLWLSGHTGPAMSAMLQY